MSASAGFQFYYHLDKGVQLRDKTLIAPVVSVANVAQLAVDILITTLELKRIGIFDPRYLHPVVGAREDGEAGVTTPLELYGKEGLDIVFIQQRSPAVKAKKSLFVATLFKFVKDHNLGALLFISGVDPSNRTDAQMNDPFFRIIPPKSPPLASTPLAKIADLPEYTYAGSELQHLGHPTLAQTLPFIPGGGLTRRLLLSLPTGWNIPTAAIVQFVLEGDNRGDALCLAGVVAGLLHREVNEWKEPRSWALGLFGTPLDQSLYG